MAQDHVVQEGSTEALMRDDQRKEALGGWCVSNRCGRFVPELFQDSAFAGVQITRRLPQSRTGDYLACVGGKPLCEPTILITASTEVEALVEEQVVLAAHRGHARFKPSRVPHSH